MSSEMLEMVTMLQKLSSEMSNFTSRQEQFEERQEQSRRAQEQSIRELRDAVNIDRRPERDKEAVDNGERLYSPSDTPLSIGSCSFMLPSNSNAAGVSYSQAPNLPVNSLAIGSVNAVTSTVNGTSAPLYSQISSPFHTQGIQTSNHQHTLPIQSIPMPQFHQSPMFQPNNYPVPPIQGFQPMFQNQNYSTPPTQGFQFQPTQFSNYNHLPYGATLGTNYSNSGIPYASTYLPTHIPSSIYHQIPVAQSPLPNYNTSQQIPYPNPVQNSHNIHLPIPSFTKYTKIEFPRFSGEDLRTWLYKVEQFFSVEDISIHQRLKLVAIHFDGDALQWHQGYMKARAHLPLPTWEEYLYALADRFGAEYTDPMTELMRVKHTGSVKEYQAAFDSVMTRLNLSVEHSISIFLNNLRPELSDAVRIGNPCNLPQAYYLARLHESNFAAQSKAIKGITSGYVHSQSKPAIGNSSNTFQKGNFGGYRRPVTARMDTNRRKRLTPAELDEKRSKGLCFLCDEKYTPGHRCKAKRQLFSMELEEGEELVDCELEVPEEEDPIEQECVEETTLESCAISLQALNGTMGYKTLRLKGFNEQNPIEVFIDCGSTHNFIDEEAAKRLGCEVITIKAQLVQVADGRGIPTNKLCKGFKWFMQGAMFQDDFLVFPVGKSDMVLGVQWLCPLGDIKFNFQKLFMEFEHQGQLLKLQGIQPKFKTVEARSITKMTEVSSQFFMIQVRSAEMVINKREEIVVEDEPVAVTGLLEEYKCIFGEPQKLPPSRGVFDHHIPLLEGVNPVNSRPYRYSPIQKDIIEKMVREMMEQGIIQHSSSPYASPVVLVGKKDGSWRLCVDYRALNMGTIKDKFPIPIIEELLDELGGSQIYSKIDLRAGYHQIRMAPADIAKTAFKTHSGHFEYLVMPFGLTNAPSSFQSLMNHIFQDHLRKFVLVFFDDILIYSKTLEDHLVHLKITFELLVKNQLLAKRSKCVFAAERVEYLGHYISAEGVATDPKKIEVVQDWPVPETLKQLRGFLGLTGYYRRFIKGYGVISKPLTELLKKDSFMWNQKATEAFKKLKVALTTAPVLVLPDFSMIFVVETDACNIGIGAVLMQKGQPIAFLSKGLSVQHQTLSVYDKELLALVMAVNKWSQYLIGRTFIVKTDQKALKFLLEQKLHTGTQLKWITKLMQYDFSIEYKKGKENKAADALSRLPLVEFSAMTLSTIKTNLLQLVMQSWEQDGEILELIQTLKTGSGTEKGYTFLNDQLRKNGRLVVGPVEQLRKEIITLWHDSPLGGHCGVDHTYRKLYALFYWKGMRGDVQEYVKGCDVCQRHKYDNAPYPGLLQPLKVPTQAWGSVSMDFIDGLPKSKGKTVIWVVVDRLTKYAHFVGLSHPYSASEIAKLFMENIYKLHGMPEDIISDRDPVFTSKLWQELFSILGVTLNTSTAYHPQTDGQTEVINRCLETYLRCFCSESQKDWYSYLATAEWWYNTTFHNSIQTTPYEALYGQPPPMHLPYIAGESGMKEVDRSLLTREFKNQLLQFHLKRAQQRMMDQANKHRSDRQFQEGDWVYLKIQPYRQVTLSGGNFNKLSAKYYGPYQVLQRIGSVAYKLSLPTHLLLHPTFHVSQLKPCHTLPSVFSHPPVVELASPYCPQPAKVLERRMIQKGNKAVPQVLVQWEQLPKDLATWEDYNALLLRFPAFIP
ncbi:uncharacterized protein LOC132608338 [Lycium barbarum]|uniref:uncharacterized protein LOC132608338 n=1 Tax=Lycium barbarum TaxID=112863 RepID=UPI00293F42B2|nr:uncharacterized protein LOC132608338 [Lycium barbarum]